MDTLILISILILIMSLLLCSSLIFCFGTLTVNSNSNSNNQVSQRLKTLIDTTVQQTQVDQIQLKTKVDQVKKSSKQLDCTVTLPSNDFVNSGKYTCSDPTNNKIITLTDGPILKISYSTEKDSFGKETKNYYIIAPYIFIINTGISLASKDIIINSLQDLVDLFDKIDKQFVSENTIPDKCLNVPIKTREEAKAPYNTTCIFFPGLNKVNSIETIIEKAFFPYIQNSILTDYFDLINTKLASQTPTLTILEYVMYLALLNRKPTFNYYTLCTSDDTSINC